MIWKKARVKQLLLHYVSRRYHPKHVLPEAKASLLLTLALSPDQIRRFSSLATKMRFAVDNSVRWIDNGYIVFAVRASRTAQTPNQLDHRQESQVSSNHIDRTGVESRGFGVFDAQPRPDAPVRSQ